MEKLINYLKNLGAVRVIYANHDALIELKINNKKVLISKHEYPEVTKYEIGKLILSKKATGKVKSLSLEIKVLESEGDVIKELSNHF